MKLKVTKHNSIDLSLVMLLIFYLLFTIADLSTSIQSGYKGADRSGAHQYLLVLTGYLGIYVLFHLGNVKLRQPLTSLILIGIWALFVNLLNSVSTWNLLVQANMSVLWVLSYIFFEKIRKKEFASKSILYKTSFVLLLFYAATTVYSFFDMMVRLNRIPVLNVVYYGVSLIPWVMISINPKYKKAIFIISMALVLLSMKRGAIIALPIMLLADSFVEGRIKGSYKGLIKVISYIVVFAIAIIITDKLSNGFISVRFSAEKLADGSGRSEQYSTIISLIKNRGVMRFFFGGGCEEPIKILGTGIHNEWLNFLFCYGLIGAILYAKLVIGFIKKSFSTLKTIPSLASACFMMTALYLVLSMVSTGYGGYHGFWLFGFWGYLNAEIDKRSGYDKRAGGKTNETVQRRTV